MKKLLGTLLLAIASTACVAHARPKLVEAPDPIVGDMTCAPPMSIHSLLASFEAPVRHDGGCDTAGG